MARITVMVPATWPFSFSTVSATKKKMIGMAAIKDDSQRFPTGSYTCIQGCMFPP